MLQSFASINALLLLIIMMTFYSRNSSENLQNFPYFLFHVARLMTRLTGVRPAVDLCRKAPTYTLKRDQRITIMMSKLTWNVFY